MLSPPLCRVLVRLRRAEELFRRAGLAHAQARFAERRAAERLAAAVLARRRPGPLPIRPADRPELTRATDLDRRDRAERTRRLHEATADLAWKTAARALDDAIADWNAARDHASAALRARELAERLAALERRRARRDRARRE